MIIANNTTWTMYMKWLCSLIAVPVFVFAAEPSLQYGIKALCIPSGAAIHIHDGQYFPLVCTFKVPLAIYCLVNEHCLDIKLSITQYDLRDGAGILRHQISHEVELSIRELLEAMIVHSDNTATDILLKRCGGPSRLTQWLKTIGLEEITVTNSCLEILTACYGIKDLPVPCTLAEFEECKNKVSSEEREKAAQYYFSAMPDRATPRAMTSLLEKLMLGQLVSNSARDFLLRCMHVSTMGSERIRKYLPQHLFTADKEGTIGHVAGDIGIIQLPERQGYLLIAAYAQGGSCLAEREECIAKASLAVYEQLCQ